MTEKASSRRRGFKRKPDFRLAGFLILRGISRDSGVRKRGLDLNLVVDPKCDGRKTVKPLTKYKMFLLLLNTILCFVFISFELSCKLPYFIIVVCCVSSGSSTGSKNTSSGRSTSVCM